MSKKDTGPLSGDAAWQATKQRIAKSNEQAYARGREARAAAAALVAERRRAADKRETASLRAHRKARVSTP